MSSETAPVQTSQTNSLEASNEASSQAYIQFLLVLAPCYIFTLIFFTKWCSIRKGPRRLISHSIYPSYKIKRAFSYFLAILYIVQIILALALPKESYWIASYKNASFLYMFGFVAWYFSAKVLERGAERNLPQQFGEHKLFWTLSFIMACLSITLPTENGLWGFCIDILKLLIGFHLTLYAIAKPFDSREAEKNFPQQNSYPRIRSFLESIEGLFFGQGNQEGKNRHRTPLLSSRDNTELDSYVNEFKAFVQKNNPHIPLLDLRGKKTSTSKTNVNSSAVPNVPKVTCRVSQNIVARDRGEDDVKIFYKVQTQVEGDLYVRLHKYANFLDLEDFIERKCDVSKAPWFESDPPKLVKVDFDEHYDEKAFIEARVKALETYINNLTADPRYMNELVVEFLGIQDPHKEAFAVYNSFIKMNSSKSRGLRYFKPNLDLSNINTIKPPKQRASTQMPFFKAYCSGCQKATYGDNFEYTFVIKDDNDANSSSWKIVKTYKDFKSFNEKLEGTVGQAIPYFEEYVPRAAQQKQASEATFANQRKLGLEKYMDVILGHRQYYRQTLYEFIEYDREREGSSRSLTPRASFYGENVTDSSRFASARL